MKRSAEVAIAIAMAGALAWTAAIPAAASAASRPAVRTYIDTTTINGVGTGSAARWRYHSQLVQDVIVRPQVAIYSVGHASGTAMDGSPFTFSDVFYYVNGVSYSKVGNAAKWKVMKLTPAQRRSYDSQGDVLVAMARFRAIRGVTRVGSGHFQVTSTVAAALSFLSYEYGDTAKDLAGVKVVTLGLWTDASGRPTKFTVLTQSDVGRSMTTETFTHYNQPMVIRAPK